MTITDTAYSLIPGHDALAAALKNHHVTHLDAPNPLRWEPTEAAARQKVSEKIETLIAAGKTVPLDIAAPIAAARSTDETIRVRNEMVLASIRSLKSTSERLTDENTADAVDYLRTELDRVITRTQELAVTLESIYDTDAAIAAGALDEWQELKHLAAEHDEIRAVQYALTRQAIVKDLGNGAQLRGEEFYRIGWAADSLDVHPYWVGLRDQAVDSANRYIINRDVQPFVDWLSDHDEQREAFDPSTVPTRRLLLLATRTQPWLPNAEEYATAMHAANYAAGAVDPNNVAQRTAARDAYYAATGLSDGDIEDFTANGPSKQAPRSLLQVQAQHGRQIRERTHGY